MGGAGERLAEPIGYRIPCYFPANSLPVCNSPLFMLVSQQEIFMPGKIPCYFPCAGNLPGSRSVYREVIRPSRGESEIGATMIDEQRGWLGFAGGAKDSMDCDSRIQGIGAGIPTRALILSFILHTGLLVWLCRQPEPMIIQRAAIMAGDNGSSLGVVYLPTDSSLRLPVNEESNSLKYAAARKRSLKRRPVAPHPTDAKVQAPSIGSPNGDAIKGSLLGWSARPALPLNFPDPHVQPSELPPGVTGDVIVEVTIDAAGNITSKKVLQSIGYGIDEKVLAVLQNWRFAPATILGRPVASRQDVHFHFPG